MPANHFNKGQCMAVFKDMMVCCTQLSLLPWAILQEQLQHMQTQQLRKALQSRSVRQFQPSVILLQPKS
jgi:hypothetical protein